VERDGQPVSLQVTPRREKDSYRIGIGFGNKITFTRLDVGGALLYSLYFPVDKTREVLSGLGTYFHKLFRRLFHGGEASSQQMGGPLEVIRQLSLAFREGLAISLLFLALLNVYLGLFNLLPVPALDGSRLMFLGFTMISRRPVNQRAENMVHTVGFVVLLGFILLVTYRDILRLLGAH